MPSPSSCPASGKRLHDNEACRVHTAQRGSASAPETWILLSEGVLIQANIVVVACGQWLLYRAAQLRAEQPGSPSSGPSDGPRVPSHPPLAAGAPCGPPPQRAVSELQPERIQAAAASSFPSQRLHSQVHSEAPRLQAARQSANDPSTPMNKKPLPSTYPQRQNTVVTTNANKLPRATQLK